MLSFITTETKESSNIIYILLTLMFAVSLRNVVHQIFTSSTSFIDWIELSVHVLILGSLLGKLLSFTILIKRITIGCALLSLYLAIGVGILHYQWEGGFVPDSLVYKNDETIDYYMELHNGLKLPLHVDFMIPLGYNDLALVKQSKITHDNRYQFKFTFRVTGSHPQLPNNLLISYRALGIVPLVGSFNYRWRSNLNDNTGVD